MKYQVHLANKSKEKTGYELFPSPEAYIKDWNEEMAERILPIAMFDLKLAGVDSAQKGFFIYYDDWSVDFLSWDLLENGMIDLGDSWKTINPFEEAPDIEAIKNYLGAYLEYETFEIEIELPSKFDHENRWDGSFEEKLANAGANDPLSRVRLGGGFPCYVQGIVDSDEPGFIAELPAGTYGLAPVYFYLFTDGKGSFSQDMQGT